MKVHTTNYTNAFIMVADDCPAVTAEVPPIKGTTKTAANLQFEQIIENPYKFTSDDVLFRVYAHKNELRKADLEEARTVFFSKGQPCMRASPLTKRYGWGVHADKDGKIALYARETPEYKQFSEDKKLEVVKAMKSAR
jgi:hypothetical protein